MSLPPRFSVASASLLVVLACNAGAQPLYIDNADFEIPAGLAEGAQNGPTYDVPGWTEYEPSGYAWEWDIYHPTDAEGDAHGGSNVLMGLAYNPGTSYVEQVLSATVQSGQRYTLSGWVADPDGHTPENGVRFMLYAGSNLLGTVTNIPSATRTWSQASLVYDAGSLYAGQALKVRIMHNLGNSYRVFIDDVSLVESPTPENFDFEMPPGLAAGAEDSGLGYSVPGWTEYEPSGYAWEWDIYNPLPTEGGAQGGTNVLKGMAYNPATSYVEQVLTNVLQSGQRYTLSGWAADPDGHTPENGARFLLYAGSSLLGTVTNTPSAARTWSQTSLVYDTGISNPLAGQPLRIRIMQNIGNGYRVFVNSIALTTITGLPSVPSITHQPSSVVGSVGGSVTLAVSVDGMPLPSLQWSYTNGSIINELPGATNATLLLTGLELADAGSYYLVATNIYGACTSSIVTLTVVQSPFNCGSAFLTNAFPEGQSFDPDTNSLTTISTGYTASGSTWQFPYWEPLVYQASLSHTASNSPQSSWTLGIGRGGQIYSLKNPLMGETIPPQVAYNNVASAWLDDNWVQVIGPHHNNPAADHDLQPALYQLGIGNSGNPTEFQQPVLSGLHYIPELPFNAPLMCQYNDSTSYSMINWQQSPQVQTDASGAVGVLTPSTLATSIRYRDVGYGALQVSVVHANFSDFEIYNFAGTPWGGVRSTTVKFVWYNLSNTATGGGFTASPPDLDFDQDIQNNYALWNSKQWGVWSNYTKLPSLTPGYMVMATGTNSSAPAMALVYGFNPNLYIIGLGYGGPVSRAFTVECVSDTANVGPHQIYWYRYYYVFDTLGDIQNTINRLSLVSDASPRGTLGYSPATTPRSYWNFTRPYDPTSSPLPVASPEAAYTCSVNGTNISLGFYCQPVTNSYPAFYMRRKSDGRRAISSDPYYFDGAKSTHTHFLTTDYLGFLGWTTAQYAWEFSPENNPTIVNLGAYYTTSAVYVDGAMFTGGVDGAGHALPACEFTNTVYWNNLPFAAGPAGAPSAVRATGQSIPLPSRSYATLQMLAASSGGATAGTFTVQYTDGTTSSYAQTIPDWRLGDPGNAASLVMTHRVNGWTGTAEAGYLYVYGCGLPLDSNKTVQSIQLPNAPTLNVLAMTLTAVPVQLNISCDTSNNPVTFPFRIKVVGPSSQTVVMEGSSDLANWVPLATNTLGNTPWIFVDVSSANSSSRYYRARLP